MGDQLDLVLDSLFYRKPVQFLEAFCGTVIFILVWNQFGTHVLNSLVF